MAEYRNALEILEERRDIPRLTTGSADLDSLLGGGIEPGHFYLFYGDGKSGVDFLVHQVIVNCLLPLERSGFEGKGVYSNCGNYKEERTLLDTRLLTHLVKAAKLDPAKALDEIYTVYAFSEEQQERTVEEVQKLLERDREIRLVMVHNIARLFTSDRGAPNRNAGERITHLQKVVSDLWQACSRNGVALVASCQPKGPFRGWTPRPEGGRYLSHKANVIVYLRKRGEKSPYFTAHLLKHPNRAPRRVDFTFSVGGEALGRVTLPFRTLLQQEMDDLKRSFQAVLMDPSRRDAFDSLVRVWGSEQGAMSYAKTPTALDVMLLTGVVDNRRLIEDLHDRFGSLESKIQKLISRLETTVFPVILEK